MFYTIGEAAEKVGVAPSALRYYDKEGLLPFVERSEGGMRMFRESDMEWLRLIECLKKTGMPIREIGRFVELCMAGDSTIDERLGLIDERLAEVEKQINQLKKTLDVLKYKHWYYETAKKAGTCAVHRDMNSDDIPEEIVKIRKRAFSE